MAVAASVAITVLVALAGCQAHLGAVTGTAAATGSRVVPRVIGDRLAAAETAIDAASLKNVTAVDASDRHREILNQTDWVVTAETPKAGTTVAAGTKVTLTVKRPTDGYGPRTVHLGVVPDVKCMNLQDAQDALRKSGFFNLRSSDGGGHGRIQILDRDWLVTAQSVGAGHRSPLTRIVLTVVKYGESTGGSGCPS